MADSAPRRGWPRRHRSAEAPSDDLATELGGDRRTADVLRRLELSVNRRLDGILHGDYRGLVPGHGSEPGEARVYVPGDDVRRIDWGVTARTSETHVRETIADRELETWIVADRSGSLNFGTARWEKRDLCLAACAGVGFLSARGGNRIGAVLSGGTAAATVPARQGRKHLMAILARIHDTPRDERSAPLPALLKRAATVARRRALVVVVSDWLDDPETWRHELATLAVRHEVLAIEVVDPRELELPNVGVITLADTETGRVREIDTSSAELRRRYRDEAQRQRQAIAEAITAAGARRLRLRTDEDWLMSLAQFVASNRRRLTTTGSR
ncbi:MAG: DUF58 domain-containing protein [Actinobacteria bacterium]|nr:DUF58 domain-containing protein [Actinomycetota bacterium]